MSKIIEIKSFLKKREEKVKREETKEEISKKKFDDLVEIMGVLGMQIITNEKDEEE